MKRSKQTYVTCLEASGEGAVARYDIGGDGIVVAGHQFTQSDTDPHPLRGSLLDPYSVIDSRQGHSDDQRHDGGSAFFS